MEEILKVKAERDALDAKLRWLCRGHPWHELADAGLTVEAVRSYREKYGAELRAAYDAVAAYNKAKTQNTPGVSNRD